MPRVKQSDIEALKDRVDIVELIGSYISLKPAGPGSFKGLMSVSWRKITQFPRPLESSVLSLLRLRGRGRRIQVCAGN